MLSSLCTHTHTPPPPTAAYGLALAEQLPEQLQQVVLI